MTLRSTLYIVMGLVVATAAADFPDDQQLIARASAASPALQSQPQQAAPQQSAADLDDLEAEARIDLMFSQARLDLVQARKALSNKKYAEAATLAQSALKRFRSLPANVDVTVYELQAEGIIARVKRVAGDQVLLGQNQPPDEQTREEMAAAAPPDQLDAEVRAAARIARQYDGADTPDIDTRGDVDILRERALRNQRSEEHGYRPGRRIIDVDAILARDQQRLYYEGALRTAYKADEARRLTAADEARIAPEGIVSYPDDWPETVAKRAKYKDGVIARSPSWYDKDGREWYVAVYDIHDLIYVPPDFQNVEGISFNPRESLRTSLDRQALRMYSEIFSGYPEDLAAGIPLLRYFGGIDDFEYRGPKYSMERQQQIVQMIKAFTGNWEDGAKIEAVAP